VLAQASAPAALHRPLTRIHGAATLDGGDVLVSGRRLYVGLSSRTNREAIEQMDLAVRPLGYVVIPVRFGGCLHLKSGVTLVADGSLLLNPAWVDSEAFVGHQAINVDPGEPHAANALRVGDTVIHPAHFPLTRARLEARGLHVAPVATIGELGPAGTARWTDSPGMRPGAVESLAESALRQFERWNHSSIV